MNTHRFTRFARLAAVGIAFPLLGQSGARAQVEDFVIAADVRSMATLPASPGFGDSVIWNQCWSPDYGRIYSQNLQTGGLGQLQAFGHCFPGELAGTGAFDIFFVAEDGSVVRSSGSDSSVRGTTPNPAGISDLTQGAVGETHYFWTETPYSFEFPDPGKLYRIGKTSGDPELVWDFAADASYPTDVAVLGNDRKVAVLASDGKLWEINLVTLGEPPFTFTVWTRTERGQRVQAMEVHDDRFYWAARTSDSRSIFFYSAPVSDLTDLSIHGIENLPAGGLSLSEIGVTDSAIYFQPVVSGTPGALRKQPLPTGTIVDAATLSTRIFDLQAQGGWVIWGKDSNTISRLSETAAPVTRDLRAVALEIVQAIQGTANDVALIAGKTTFARAFARIESSSAGDTSLPLTPGMVLHGADSSGARLPDSPLYPQRNPPVTNAIQGGNRSNQNDGFWFKLPDEWTRRGEVTLRAEVNPSRALSETTRANNSISVTRPFLDKVPVCMVMIPTVTHLGTFRRYSPHYQETFDYLEALLPTSELRVNFVSGDTLDEAGHLVWEHSPFEFEEDVDDDKDKVITGLFWKKVFGSGGPHCEPDGGFDHYVSMLPQHPSIGYSGYARIGTDVITEGMSLFFFNSERSSLDVPLPATTQAQELSHNYGRWHVDCGDPSNVDTNYWYPPDVLSDEGHLGFDPIRRNLIAADGAKDFMSYCGPKWVSPYTWHEMDNRISTRSSPAPLIAGKSKRLRSETLGGDKADYPPRLVSGLIGRHGHESEVFPAIALSPEETARALAGISGDGQPLELHAYAGKNLIAVSPARTFVPLLDEGAHDSDQHGFAGVLEADANATRVEVVDPENPGTPLATLTGGGNAPIVQVTFPAGGEEFTAPFSITWNGDHNEPPASQGPLAYTVRFSPDSGETWTMLTENYAGTTLMADPANLPGSPSPDTCLFEVLASDGLLTGSDRSEKFTIANKLPEAYIFFEGDDGKSTVNLAHATFQCGETVILHGVAHDVEDGALGEFAMGWSVDGPVSRFGQGATMILDDLPPGVYDVELFAFDSVQGTASATAGLTVKPRYVPEAGGEVVLDGACGDPGYEADACRTEIRYPDTNNHANARMVRLGDNLHICIEGLEMGKNPNAFVSVLVDVDNNGSATTEEGDLRFDLILPDAEVRTSRGAGTVWQPDEMPDGIQGFITERDGRWIAEILIGLSRVGGWNNQTVGVALLHSERNGPGDSHIWPAGASFNNPGTWAKVVLGTDAGDPSDINENGLPDQWELNNHGTLVKADADLDGDGQSEEAEFIAGTDPNDPSSYFKPELHLAAAENAGDKGIAGSVSITWPTAPHRSYEIWRSVDLINFFPLASGIASSPTGTAEWTDPAPPSGRVFYQVRIVYFR